MSTVKHLATEQRFVLEKNQVLCEIRYDEHDQQLDILHTYVPPELSGQGIAAELTIAALNYAQKHKLKVNPICSYTKSYLKRHEQQYQDLLIN